VSGIPITTFPDLLAHLDGLQEAAWGAGVDPRLARQLAAARPRLVRLHAHLTGADPVSGPAPRPVPKTLRGDQDLIAGLDEVMTAARAGRALPMALTHYLHNVRHRLNFFLRGGESRLSSRQEPEGDSAATLEAGDRRQQVSLVDRSPFGMGVRAAEPVDTDRIVRLHCRDQNGGDRTYECLTVRCRPDGQGYHVGLEIFTSRLTPS